MRSVGRRGFSDHPLESDPRIIGLLSAAQSASELRLLAAQSAIKNDLQAAQSVMKNDLQTAQSASELRTHAAQSAIKDDLQSAQSASELRMQATQSASELRFREVVNLNSYKLLGAICAQLLSQFLLYFHLWAALLLLRGQTGRRN